MSEVESSGRPWSIGAAAVFLEHLLRGGGPRPGKFRLKTLCHWAFALLHDAWDAVLEELKRSHTTLRPCLGEEDDAFVVLKVVPGKPEREVTKEDLELLLGQVTKPLETMNIEWLPMLRQIMKNIAEVLIDRLPEDLASKMTKLKEIQVQHATMFGEDWSVPYEVCWQADGAALSIVLPDVPNYSDRHFDYFKTKLKHQSRGQTILYELLGLWIVPSHEVIHIVQHLRGNLLDSDPKSYAMEHDASRLNYILLWEVLKLCQESSSWPPYWMWVMMLEGVNRCQTGQTLFQSSAQDDEYQAYCQWAKSFGLDSPEACFKKAGDEAALMWESAVKWLVAGHALGLSLEDEAGPAAGGGNEATEQAVEALAHAVSKKHLEVLLHACFRPQRSGDVYSDENRAAVTAALPQSLVLDDCEAATQRLLHPTPASADCIAQLANRLRNSASR